MLSIGRLLQTNRAADSASETPSETRRDFFPRRKVRQTPSRESGRAADSTESPIPRFLPRGCFLAYLRPQSWANKEQRPRIYESKKFASRRDLAELLAATDQRRTVWICCVRAARFGI